jgi:hypothetical protein
MNVAFTRRRLALLASVVLAAVAGVVLSCGTDADSTFGDGGPCNSVYKGRCGGVCTIDEHCPAGLFCGGTTCTAECAAGSTACSGGTTCSPRGRCVIPGLGNISDSSSGGSSGGDACIDLDVNLAKVTPTVALLVDQSSTMTIDFGGSGRRWDVVRDVLMNPDGGIVKTLEGDVAFGLSFYTRGGPAPPPPLPTCPRLLSAVAALNNHAALVSHYVDAGGPADGTPTGESIDKLMGRVNGTIVDGGGFATLPTPGPKILVLATDGEPDSCSNHVDGSGRGRSIEAAQAAFQAGVKTFVISVGTSVGQDHLKEMANVGVGQPAATGDASPFTTTNRQEFVSAMNSIIFSVRSCIFKLGGAVEPGQESKGTVTLDGTPLVLNDPNGWRLNNASELEVLGTSCNAIKTTSGRLAVRFPCGAFNVGTIK